MSDLNALDDCDVKCVNSEFKSVTTRVHADWTRLLA